MQFLMDTLDAVGRGDVTVAFRRWKRPTVRQGGTLTTRVGVLSIDALDAIGSDDITPADARAAGHASPADVVAAIGNRTGQLYLVRFHLAGPDPRLALREQAALGDDD